MSNASVIEPSEYLTETDIEERWPMLKPGEMRRARKADLIEWFAFPTGPHYTAEAVQLYIDLKYRRTPSCHQSRKSAPQPNGNTEVTTSTFPTPTEVESTMPAGMTPDLAQSAAEACAQRMARKRSMRSSPSSPQRRPGRSMNALTLAQS